MKVLVAIDNRPSSQATVDALIKMHWSEGTEINLLTVFDHLEEDGESSPEHKEMENVAVDLCHTLKQQCETRFLARTGDPRTVILETADHIGAELIVLGSNCKSTLERLILGSVSQGVINNSKCPVIVAKTPCSLAREVSPSFGKVLVAVDNSVFSDIAVRWLANFRWLPTTQFIVSAVVPLDANFEEVENSLRERGTHLSQFLKTDNILIDAATGSPEHEIVNLAKKHYADLIVMGSHGHSGLKEMVIGSVSDAVSHTAPCAVAIVRAPAFENSAEDQSGDYHKVMQEDQSGDYHKAMQEDTPAPDSEHNDAQRARDDIYVHAMPAGMGGL